jgi:hypothetical protein
MSALKRVLIETRFLRTPVKFLTPIVHKRAHERQAYTVRRIDLENRPGSLEYWRRRLRSSICSWGISILKGRTAYLR